jgi:hypothetical protein
MRPSGGQLRSKAWEKNPRPVRGRVHMQRTKARMFCQMHGLQLVTDVLAGDVTLACGCKRQEAA